MEKLNWNNQVSRLGELEKVSRNVATGSIVYPLTPEAPSPGPKCPFFPFLGGLNFHHYIDILAKLTNIHEQKRKFSFFPFSFFS